MIDAKWVGSKMPGKPWIGDTAPMCVLHTLEFNGWPNPDKWDAPSHFVYNPRTQELRQYVSTSRAAYSLRKNSLEDDYFTLQIELWGRAKDVPNYDDEWYKGVAALLSWVNTKYGIPLTFADFSVMRYGTDAPQRKPDAWWGIFSGFLGHAHFGKGVDAHWDPGMLDIKRIESFIDEIAIPAWAVQYWQPYVDKYWPGGAPLPDSPILHYQLANILAKAGLNEGRTE